MVSNFPSRILSFIIMTFFIALIYGLYLTTRDFMGANYNPVVSGHKAASNIYSFFGTASEEIKRNESDSSGRGPMIVRKIAMPYAITADLAAIWGGKIEIRVSSLIHDQQNKS